MLSYVVERPERASDGGMDVLLEVLMFIRSPSMPAGKLAEIFPFASSLHVGANAVNAFTQGVRDP